MSNQLNATELLSQDLIQSEISPTLSANETNNQVLPDNPIIQRALRRLKESQEKENHVSHYTKHGSHSTHSKGSW